MGASDFPVAASSEWRDDEGISRPAGEVHGWTPGRNSTVCGLALSRTRLRRFAHVRWSDVQPGTGGSADEVGWLCPRCAAAASGGKRDVRPWTRKSPRP